MLKAPKCYQLNFVAADISAEHIRLAILPAPSPVLLEHKLSCRRRYELQVSTKGMLIVSDGLLFSAFVSERFTRDIGSTVCPDVIGFSIFVSVAELKIRDTRRHKKNRDYTPVRARYA